MMLEQEIQNTENALEIDKQIRSHVLPDFTSDSLLMLAEGDSERIKRYESMLQRAIERTQKQLLDWRNRRHEGK